MVKEEQSHLFVYGKLKMMSMQVKLWIYVVLGAFSTVSCSQNERLEQTVCTETIKVTAEEFLATKVGFKDGTADFFWTQGDKIGVTTTTSKSVFSVMDLISGVGESIGMFQGSISGVPEGIAVYPFGNGKMENGNFIYNLPDEYSYGQSDSQYANPAGISHNAPMWGVVENGSVTFKHLGGVIAFELNNLPENTAGLKLIVSTDNGQLSGDFTVDINSTNPPVISTVEDYGESEVVIMFNTGENQTTAYVYLPVPTGNVGNILAIIKNGDRQIGMGAWDNVSIARTAIRRAVIGKKTIIGGSDDK